MEVKPGRPRERKGDYQRITLEIRDDLLAYLDSKSGSRRDNVEQLLEQEKEKHQMSGFHPSPQVIDAWADGMLNQVADDMAEKDMDITSESLSKFFEEQYGLTFTPEDAQNWLSEQDWYNK